MEEAAVEEPAVARETEAESEPAQPKHGSNTRRNAARELSRDPELAEFRKAHDARQGGSLSRAHELYTRYLERYPNGRFVPEARYNLALMQLKRGQVQEARRGLEPFAEGRFGNYRQQQAQALLDALSERTTP
jgi:TolA-binding protein